MGEFAIIHNALCVVHLWEFKNVYQNYFSVKMTFHILCNYIVSLQYEYISVYQDDARRISDTAYTCTVFYLYEYTCV